MLQKAIA